MRVVEIRATPGAPALVWRDDPICNHCGDPATVGLYHRSVSGRSHELIYWCEEFATRMIGYRDEEIGVGHEAPEYSLHLTVVPPRFDGWFENLDEVTRL